jgi:tRNA pseudouridine38-40 synthase
MRTIKLIIAYDGTDFLGWQRQAGKARTVQATLEAALEKMHCHPVALAGAGRTDSGVHARGQAASFRTDIENIKPCKFVPALNSLLPADVRIMDSSEAGADFHARFDARMRTYRYFFIAGRQAPPHESRYALQLWRIPDINMLNSYCRLLPGERDCAIFAGAGDASKSTFRNITHAVFMVEGGRLVFEISANAFLFKMVRSVAGTFLHYGERDTPAEQLRDIIATGDRSLAGPTLPPQGLFLWKVDY